MESEMLKALLVKAGRYTAKYEKTALEVREKLEKWSDGEISSSEVAAIISQLTEEGFIDEVRYAEKYVRDKLVMLKKGPILIRIELKDKGIGAATIQKTLDAIPYEDWFKALEAYMQPRVRRHREKAKNGYDFRRRLIDMAYRRGYPSDIYEEVIEQYLVGEDVD